MIALSETTIIQTHDPKDANGYVKVIEVRNASLSLDPRTPLTIDGQRWATVRSAVSINTGTGAVVTTITAIKEN